MNKRNWIVIGVFLGLLVLLGVVFWCCCGGLFSGQERPERVRFGAGEGQTVVTGPATSTPSTGPSTTVRSSSTPLKPAEKATQRLSEELEHGWVRCVLPPELPPFLGEQTNSPTFHVREGVLTLSVPTAEGSASLLPEPHVNMPSLGSLFSLVTGDQEGIEESMTELAEQTALFFEPVAIVQWSGAFPGQQGTCRVTNEIVPLDIPVHVTWKDGEPAAGAEVQESAKQQRTTKTDADGLAQIKVFKGSSAVVTVEHPDSVVTAVVAQIVEEGSSFEVVLDTPMPEEVIVDDAFRNQYPHLDEETLVAMAEAQRQADVSRRKFCLNRQQMDEAWDLERTRHDDLIDGLEETLASEALEDEVRDQLTQWLEETEDGFDEKMRKMAEAEKQLGQFMNVTLDAAGTEMPDCEALLAE